ncbi:MAG: branched-subunit amino acid aminotransferase/4-amino-4-deoxychorismate lyase [Myxococcota bacterium]|jgi:branched-subunit amino acid aminotransferase/4-amino-4-deoxychorismate lyase
MSSRPSRPTRRILVDGGSPGGSIHLDVEDPALTTGLSVFETLRTFGGKAVLLERHLARLKDGSDRLGLSCPVSDLRQEVFRVTQGWDCELKVRITLFGGGVRSVCATSVSQPPESLSVALRPWPGPTGIETVKHGSRAPWVISVRESGADDVLWVADDHYLEATTGNVLAVCDGVLITPPLDGRILPGITRAVLLEVAADLGIPVREVPLSADAELAELYLSSSLKILAPVTTLNEQPAPGEGPVGRRLREGFYARVC